MADSLTPAELAAYATLKRTIYAIRLNLGRQLRDVTDLSLVQFEILFFLDQAPDGLRMHEIAGAVGLSRSGLTYQVSQLEQAGWVQRSSGETNSRAVIATLTDAGREHVAGLQEQHLAFVRERVFQRLSKEELELMTSIFGRIAEDTA